MKKTICSIVTAVSAAALYLMLPAAAISAAVDLPQTSQTTCYDEAGTVIACPGTGQDGDSRAGVAWPQPPVSTWPMMVQSTSSGSMPARSTASAMQIAPRSTAEKPESDPCMRPKAVRA